MTNVLILSCGTRNKIVNYFKKSLQGRGNVVCADCSSLAPALYEADRHYIVPKMTEPQYPEAVLDICRRERISGVLSLIDPELSLLAEHAEEFNRVGTKVIGSSYELCEISFDKMLMYKWLTEHGYKSARSYGEKEAFFDDAGAGLVNYPVLIKPVKGSASISVFEARDRADVEILFSHRDGLMIQELMNGQEIGVDVYVDMISGETVSVFTKKKLKMRAGETDKSVSFKDDRLFELIERFVKEAGYRGQIDIDVFEVNGEYYISEVNPRFGGGYPHAYECGCDHMKLIINNLTGVENQRNIGKYEDGIYMMKYVDAAIMKL